MKITRRALAGLLSILTVAFAPGLAPYQAAAQVVSGAAAGTSGAVLIVPRSGAVPGAGLAPLSPAAGLAPSLNGGLLTPSIGVPSFIVPASVLAASLISAAAIPFLPASALAARPLSNPVAASPNILPDGRPDGALRAPDAKTSLALEGDNLSAAADGEKRDVLDAFFTGARQIYGRLTGVSDRAIWRGLKSGPLPQSVGQAAVAPALRLAEAADSSAESNAAPPHPIALEGRGLQPGERFLSSSVGDKATTPARAPGRGDNWVDWKAVKWMFVQRNISISLFILTSIAYPSLVIPAVGPVLFGVLMALGPLASIALGPLNGLIANKLQPREGLTLLTLLRGGLALVLPVLALTGTISFWPLLIASIANGWQFSLLMTSENAFFRKFVGKNHIGNITTLGYGGYFALQVLLGSLLGAGGWVDAWGAIVPFWISAAGHMGLAALVWFNIPSLAPVAAKAAESAASWAERGRKFAADARAFLRRYWKEAALFAGSLAAYGWGLPLALPVIGTGVGSPLWMAGALFYWISRTDAFKQVWAQKGVRAAILLSALAGGLIYPFQNLVLPLVAVSLGAKALIYGQLLGALFFGQLIANAALAKGLPKLFGRPIEHWVRGVVVAMGAAWAYLGLFPGSLLAAAVATAVSSALIFAAARLTHRGWIRFLGVGLASSAGLALSWGFYPGIFMSVMLLGLFVGPFVSAINAYINKTSKPEDVGTNFGVSSSLFSAALSLGYGLMTMNVKVHGNPAFPGALTPIMIAYLLAGVVFFFAPRWLPGLPGKSFRLPEPKKPAAAS